MRLMNSVGVLYGSLSPTDGRLSSTSTALPFPHLHGRISRANAFHAMPWFMRLVEILCNFRPLLWHYLHGSFSMNLLHPTGGTSRLQRLIDATSLNQVSQQWGHLLWLNYCEFIHLLVIRNFLGIWKGNSANFRILSRRNNHWKI